ncbi:MAG: YdeI/OmpD-associated family protein [Bacteroidota bacterium]
MAKDVNTYFIDGCGRCPLGGTPACKVHNWEQELEKLRMLVLECGLNEESKWGVPTYSFQNKNILIVAALKDYATISFFKGALLQDEEQILFQQTENMQSARLLRFTSVKEINELEATIKHYIFEAIEVEKAGLKVEFKKASDYTIPEELEAKFKEDPTFETAFYELTPGRQKGYLLHFAAPKQAKTRETRIESCVQQIFYGKGLHDDYKAAKK